MPTVARSCEIAADAERVWTFAVDPRNLPKWWPGTTAVRSVRGSAGIGQTWRQVFVTKKGREVAADQKCSEYEAKRSWSFEQQTEGTPFEKILRSARVQLRLDADDGATLVTLRLERRMRGMSALGGIFVRRAGARTLNHALGNLRERFSAEKAR